MITGKTKIKTAYLIGYMGAGKSVVSRELGDALNLPVVDTDQMIQENMGLTIPEIFDTLGEDAFREKETQILDGLAGFRGIVSCGGGMALREENRQLMRENGFVIWLMASPETVFERIAGDPERPLATEITSIEEISSMMEERAEAYQDACHMTVDTEGKTPTEVCGEIIKRLADLAQIEAQQTLQDKKDKKDVPARNRVASEDEEPGEKGHLSPIKVKPVKIGNVELGTGLPKICISITGRTHEEILEKCRAIAKLPSEYCQIAEWRADYYQHVYNGNMVTDMLGNMRSELRDIPLLVTYRTRDEGGQGDMTPDMYASFYLTVLKTGLAQAIDLECLNPNIYDSGNLKVVIRKATEAGIAVIGSNHDFEKTPWIDDIQKRLITMFGMGVQVGKVAYMPLSREDVLNLMEASIRTSKKGLGPVISISMGDLGRVSRLAGSFTGSAMTFAALGEDASAPGQVAASKLATALRV